MSRKGLLITTIAGLVTMASPAFPQSEPGSTPRNEVSVQALGSWVKSTSDNGVQNSATNSGGVLGSYRFFFNEHNGVEANYGYTQNTQSYGLTEGILGVKSYSHEASAAYVFRAPMRHFTPFALAGVGALIFDPRDFAGASAQSRAAFVYGGGADFNLTHNLFMRAEYRGLVYDSPTFGLNSLSGVERATHRAEPSIGFGYRF